METDRMETGKLRFENVLGLSFDIAADRDSAYLESLLERYRLTLENTRKQLGLCPTEKLKLAILTGFLLCDEIEKMKTSSRECGEAEQRIKNMTAQLSDVIPHE